MYDYCVVCAVVVAEWLATVLLQLLFVHTKKRQVIFFLCLSACLTDPLSLAFYFSSGSFFIVTCYFLLTKYTHKSSRQYGFFPYENGWEWKIYMAAAATAVETMYNFHSIW